MINHSPLKMNLASNLTVFCFSFACFDAIKTRKNRGSLTSINTYTYGYGKESGCNWRTNHCGPNYCCCQAF